VQRFWRFSGNRWRRFLEQGFQQSSATGHEAISTRFPGRMGATMSGPKESMSSPGGCREQARIRAGMNHLEPPGWPIPGHRRAGRGRAGGRGLGAQPGYGPIFSAWKPCRAALVTSWSASLTASASRSDAP